MMHTMSSTVQEFGSFTTTLLMSIDSSSVDGCVAHTYKYIAVTLIMLLCCRGALQPVMCGTHHGQCMEIDVELQHVCCITSISEPLGLQEVSK